MNSKMHSGRNLLCGRVRIAGLFLVAILFPLLTNAVDLLSGPAPSFSSPASAGGDSYISGLSADGRYVLFNSTANNLAHRTNGSPYLLPHPGKMNAFVHDRVLGKTTLVSVDPTDTWAGDADSSVAAISTNGQFVLFESGSHNLVPGAALRTNSAEIYLRDVVNKTTTWVTTRLSPISTSGASFSVMTPDARYVAFSSGETNLALGDTNTAQDVFVRDLSSGQTRLLSAGIPGFNSFFGPVITSDGKFVAFQSSMLSINNTQDVYVCDMDASNTFCLSTNAHQFISGVPACYGQEISQDGKYVVYQANANVLSPTTAYIFRHNLATGAEEVVTSNAFPATGTQPLDMTPDGRFIAFLGRTNGHTGVFLWDGLSATTTYVSVSTNGLISPNLVCDSPAIDTTGRFVSFTAAGDNLVTNAVGLDFHIYRRDLLSGVTELVDVGLDGDATNRTINSDFYMSADGKAIVFDSPDTDLVEQDGNGASDVFVRDFDSETTELASSSEPTLLSRTSGYADTRGHVHVSVDGSIAVFIARGDGLVPGQTNRLRQVFARDLINQSNFLVSFDTNGLGGANGPATDCAVSGDGRYIAFTSFANNLVENDTNRGSDVFLRDLQLGITTRISTNEFDPGGQWQPGNGNGSWTVQSINSDGRYVTYGSLPISSPLLIHPLFQNLSIYDQVQRTNNILTTNGVSSVATTPDGRYVAFSGPLVSGGTPNVYLWDAQLKQRIFTNLSGNWVTNLAISTNGQWIGYVLGSSLKVIDRVTKSNINVSTGPFGLRPNPRFSGDGRYLVYATAASNSVMDTNSTRDVYVFDILTRSNLLVSRSFFTGNASSGNSELPDISADGRYITYQSDAPDIVPVDNNGRVKDVFLFDQLTGSTVLLSASLYGVGTADSVSRSPSFTADGQTLAFQSWATDLTANDFNQGSDLFLFKILSASGSTNPPPVLTGQILINPGSGSGTGQTTPQITWAATPGFGYQVQYKTNLTDDTWLPVNGSVVIQNGVGYLKDAVPDPDHRFYRIVAY